MGLYKRFIERQYLRMRGNLAYYDELTGCYNRAFFNRELAKRLKSKECNLVLIDLNNLKDVNDIYGHSAGDKYIQDAATALKSYGTLCRIGGDEFILVLYDDQLESFIAYADNDHKIAYGIATKPANKDIQKTIVLADKIMYACKLRQKKEA